MPSDTPKEFERKLVAMYARNRYEGNICQAIAAAEAKENQLSALSGATWSVVKLAEELCDTVDRASEGIGSKRSVDEILAELGPAVDHALGYYAAEAKEPT